MNGKVDKESNISIQQFCFVLNFHLYIKTHSIIIDWLAAQAWITRVKYLHKIYRKKGFTLKNIENWLNFSLVEKC